MDDEQRAICSRVKALREEIGMSQPAFAERLGMTVDQVAGIEYGRAPLKFAAGHFLCSAFDINQRYLATGAKPKEFYVPTPEATLHVPPNALFSVGYDEYLRPSVEDQLQKIAIQLHCAIEDIKSADAHGLDLVAIRRMSAETLTLMLEREVQDIVHELPASAYFHFHADFSRFRGQWFKVNAEWLATLRRGDQAIAEHRALLASKKDNRNEQLTYIPLKGNVPGVRYDYATLRQMLKEETSAPGMKRKLADFMHVTPPRVSEWLREKKGKIPGGDATLRLLEWLKKRGAYS